MTEEVASSNISEELTLPMDGMFKSEEEKLFNFMNKQIEHMKDFTALNLNNETPGYFEMTRALSNYGNVRFSLISTDVMAKIELKRAKDAYEDWWDTHYNAMRKELCPSTLAGNKFPSKEEIGCAVRSGYPNEYRPLKDAVDFAQMKVDFCRRALDAWDNQSMVLSRICKNIDGENVPSGFYKAMDDSSAY